MVPSEGVPVRAQRTGSEADTRRAVVYQSGGHHLDLGHVTGPVVPQKSGQALQLPFKV